jgi:hypothetical protein
MPNAQDRDVPTDDVGKLEPNYYCRAWNAKRRKYCRAPAGSGTQHPGEGRCRHHGGLAPITHGRYSKLKSPRLRELIAEHAGDANPLDLLPEVAATRALFERYLETGGDDIDADTLAEGIRLAENVSRIVERIERMRSANAITLPELERFMFAMGQVVKHHVAKHVKDETAVTAIHEAIQEDWLALRF